jgi:hypothetical protein
VGKIDEGRRPIHGCVCTSAIVGSYCHLPNTSFPYNIRQHLQEGTVTVFDEGHHSPGAAHTGPFRFRHLTEHRRGFSEVPAYAASDVASRG